MKCFIILATLLLFFNINAQNLVPNGSFEEFTECPKNYSDFVYLNGWKNLVKYSTPDLFSTCASLYSTAHPKSRWCQVDVKKDSSFAGIVVHTHKSKYREYLGVNLKQPLKKDSAYLFQISLAIPKLSRFKIDTLGILFTEKILYSPYEGRAIVATASISIPLDSLKIDGSWFDFEIEYTATGKENYINIGNFLSVKDTKAKKMDNRNAIEYRSKYNFSYLCIDQVSVKQISNHKKKDEKSIDIKNENIEQKSDSITLSDIRFKTNSWELEQKDIPELNSLIEYLKNNMAKKIVVEGHTDNRGTYSNNQKLSLKRAESIAQYISEKGIEMKRISVVGHASDNPVSSNETPEGRRLNRRVVVKIK